MLIQTTNQGGSKCGSPSNCPLCLCTHKEPFGRNKGFVMLDFFSIFFFGLYSFHSSTLVISVRASSRFGFSFVLITCYIYYFFIVLSCQALSQTSQRALVVGEPEGLCLGGGGALQRRRGIGPLRPQMGSSAQWARQPIYSRLITLCRYISSVPTPLNCLAGGRVQKDRRG